MGAAPTKTWLGVCLTLLTFAGNAQEPKGADGSALPTTSWPTNGGDLANRRYSPLTAIDRGNVAELKGVWRVGLDGSGTGPQYKGEAQPIVDDGVLFISTGANDVFAIDVETGARLWDYRADLDPGITTVCASCHGTDGSGGPAFTAGLSLAPMRHVVVQGRNEMPAFGAMMTPEHLRDVTAHAARLLVP